MLAALALLGASAVASAAPYAINHQGTIANSTFPEIINGQTYTVTFVFDNGGTSANSQTWSGANLTCVIWRMNNARDVSYVQNLVATPPSGLVAGSATTDASGALTGMFSSVNTLDIPLGGVPAGAYTTSGITLTPPVGWFADGAPTIFIDSEPSGGSTRRFDDAAGSGVPMNIASWSAPQRVTGACDDTPYVAPPAVTVAPVPTLGEWSLALLGLAAAGLGARRLRRRSKG
ncbi:MAG: IPTL-CTERM sorting domain-containing protein [Burkholderiaceae bacterium]